MKIRPLVAWLIGIAAAALAFFTVGIWFIFNVTFSVVHGGFGGSGAVMLGSWIVVLAGCAALAYVVKKVITRRS